MFADNQGLLDASFVKDKETGLYLMVKSNSTLPKNYEVVETLKDVPIPIISLLSIPRPIVENLRVLLGEDANAKKYLSKLFDYEKTVIEILEGPKNSQG